MLNYDKGSLNVTIKEMRNTKIAYRPILKYKTNIISDYTLIKVTFGNVCSVIYSSAVVMYVYD